VLREIPLPANPATGAPATNVVAIVQVAPNGPAALAGLLPSDIILGVDNHPILTAGDVTRWVEKRTVKESVTLVIVRRDLFGSFQQMPQVRVLLPPGPVGSAPPPPAPQPTRPQSGLPPPGTATAVGPTLAWLGVKPNVKTQPVKVHFDGFHNCYAIAPPGWFITGQRKEGDAVDFSAPDGSAASWGSVGVAGSLKAYRPTTATPQAFIHWLISLSGQFEVTYGQPIQDQAGYIWQPYVKEGSKLMIRGVYIYHVFPVPFDPQGYILISRTIQTPKQIWEEKGALALMVGFSIRCNVQLRASPDITRPRSDDDKEESTYNQQLGTEYAHNPDTGEIYSMSHATDWKETGPQGAGYYIRAGNEWKKLEAGLGVGR
jgi:hypothetical protein